MSKLDIADIRQEYGSQELLENQINHDPLQQFEDWFAAYLKTANDAPNAMVLSTIDSEGYPDSRVVLLKGLDNGAFIFYTNYKSAKGLQMEANPQVALNFYWPNLMRQVRVKGKVERVNQQQADEYFYSRPIASQLSTLVSSQSAEINGREELDQALSKLFAEYTDKRIVRPEYWGGYAVIPSEIEFWQGRDNRLHDRIQYYRKEGQWCYRRLAP